MDYKVVPYEPAKQGEDAKCKNYYGVKETRFCVVSVETGEVLDDAQGYGYKTAQKAHAAYGYKTRDRHKGKAKQQKTRHIQQWMKTHKDFVDAMDEVSFEITKGSWGPNAKFDTKQVCKMLKDFELEPDFTAAELLKVWRKN
jgi:hypothetical protein